jgi:hypothetical protein
MNANGRALKGLSSLCGDSYHYIMMEGYGGGNRYVALSNYWMGVIEEGYPTKNEPEYRKIILAEDAAKCKVKDSIRPQDLEEFDDVLFPTYWEKALPEASKRLQPETYFNVGYMYKIIKSIKDVCGTSVPVHMTQKNPLQPIELNAEGNGLKYRAILMPCKPTH